MNLALASMGEPSLNALIGMGFFSVCGYMLADVMCDAIIVERSQLEVEGKVGTMQAVGYMARYIGNVVGATLGTILYNEAEWGWGLSISNIYLLNGLSALVLVGPVTWQLSDPNHVLAARSLREQLEDIWEMVQRKTIFVPMSFIAVCTLFPSLPHSPLSFPLSFLPLTRPTFLMPLRPFLLLSLPFFP